MRGPLGGRVGTAAAGVKEWSEVVARTVVSSVSRRKRFSEDVGNVTPGTTPHAVRTAIRHRRPRQHPEGVHAPTVAAPD